MRLRIKFSKTEAMRYTSHLDLHRTWERTFRRAGLPLAYSEGFHPQPKINLASALPLGITSECELVDIWIENWIELSIINDQLTIAQPPGIKLLAIVEVDNNLPSLQTDLIFTLYEATIPSEVENPEQRVDAIIKSTKLIRERRGKKYDLRPLIEKLSTFRNQQNDKQIIRMQLTAREGATGRPDEVLSALSIDPTSVSVHRVKMLFRDSESPKSHTQLLEEV